MMIGNRQRLRDVFVGELHPALTGRQPACDPQRGRKDQREALKTFDQRHVVVRRPAEMQALDFHSEVPRPQFFALGREAEGPFERLERDFAKDRLKRWSIAGPASELCRRPKQLPASTPAGRQIGGGVFASVLRGQQSELHSGEWGWAFGRLNERNVLGRRLPDDVEKFGQPCAAEFVEAGLLDEVQP